MQLYLKHQWKWTFIESRCPSTIPRMIFTHSKVNLLSQFLSGNCQIRNSLLLWTISVSSIISIRQYHSYFFTLRANSEHHHNTFWRVRIAEVGGLKQALKIWVFFSLWFNQYFHRYYPLFMVLLDLFGTYLKHKDTYDFCFNILNAEIGKITSCQIAGNAGTGKSTIVTWSLKTRNKSHGAILRYRSLKFQWQKYCQKVKFGVLVFL